MANNDRPIIVWFRRDLRLADNPALEAAVATGRAVIPVYVFDDHLEGRPIGAASRWWLHGSLKALGNEIATRGGRLILRRGNAEAEIRRLIDQTGADAVYMNRLFEPEAFQRDADIAHSLRVDGVECRGFNGSLLSRPGDVMTGSGGPYKVFTPFRNALLAKLRDRSPMASPASFSEIPGATSDDLDVWALRPTRPDWATGFDWTPGEAGAEAALGAFVSKGLKTYSTGRDHPAQAGVSRLSPHLHWGEVAVWHVVQRVRMAASTGQVGRAEAEKFVSELAWREFSAHLLHHFPTLPTKAWKSEYDALPWRDDPEGFRAWSRGLTGYPIVDAGMRQLWATGWMHNRVRMIAASFLVKDLLIDWREGEAWFWDTLVDADLGNNAQNWQWIAGSGADASPFFRIFNPVTQGERFDKGGRYVRQWVPELAALPDKWLHAPWTAPAAVRAMAGVTLGRTYPHPIVDHAEARDRALAALKAIKSARYDQEDGE